jgi:hypothetical protein
MTSEFIAGTGAFTLPEVSEADGKLLRPTNGSLEASRQKKGWNWFGGITICSGVVAGSTPSELTGNLTARTLASAKTLSEPSSPKDTAKYEPFIFRSMHPVSKTAARVFCSSG